MAQNHGASFEASAMLDFAGEDVADSAQARVPEFVFAHILHDGSAVFRVDVRGKLCPFGYDHNAEVAAAGVAQTDRLRDFLDIERNLRDQDYIRAAGHSAVDGNPS